MSRAPDEIDLGDGRVVVLRPSEPKADAGPEPGSAPPRSWTWSYRSGGWPPRASQAPYPPVRRRPSWRLPVLLFVLTFLSTVLVGGWQYGLGIITILVCHEAGHYLQARRYGVPASLPIFLPLPISPLGTLGAVIGMQPRTATGRQMFDIAISGPLAGLVPTILCLAIGLPQSTVVPAAGGDGTTLELGEPLLLQWLTSLFFDIGPDQTLLIGPLAFAGWAGLLITSLNLLPIGQLDGGHLIYTLLPRRAYEISISLLLAAAFAVIVSGYWAWSLMIVLLFVFGVRHPPLAEDPAYFQLGRGRKILGWATLLLSLLLAFTPMPFQIE